MVLGSLIRNPLYVWTNQTFPPGGGGRPAAQKTTCGPPSGLPRAHWRAVLMPGCFVHSLRRAPGRAGSPVRLPCRHACPVIATPHAQRRGAP